MANPTGRFVIIFASMPQAKRVAIYVRVSTSEQTTENQLLDLREYCSTRGWTVVKTFDDSGISGAKKNRKALDELMAFVRAGRCECVLVWKYDRFARSVSHLFLALDEFRELGVDFTSLRDSFDTTTPHGRLFFTFIAGFAEFERDIIRERIYAGLRRARAQGKRLGRPGLPDSTIKAILAQRGQATHRVIATRLRVSKSIVSRVLATNGGPNVAMALDGTHVADLGAS